MAPHSTLSQEAVNFTVRFTPSLLHAEALVFDIMYTYCIYGKHSYLTHTHTHMHQQIYCLNGPICPHPLSKRIFHSPPINPPSSAQHCGFDDLRQGCSMGYGVLIAPPILPPHPPRCPSSTPLSRCPGQTGADQAVLILDFPTLSPPSSPNSPLST